MRSDRDFLHSAFLNDYFPLVPASTGPRAGPDPVWWGAVIRTCVDRYWPFLLATVLSRRSDFARSFRTRPGRKEALLQPYLNVIRMHVLILLYAVLQRAGLAGWFLYAVLVFYFLPAGAVKELVERRLAESGA